MEPRPDVIVDFVFEDGMLFVAVQNIGSQPAQQVHVTFEPPFRGLGGAASVPELPLFRNIEFLAPSRSIRTLLDSSAAYFARQEPESDHRHHLLLRPVGPKILLHDSPRSRHLSRHRVRSKTGKEFFRLWPFFVISLMGTSTFVWISATGSKVPLPASVKSFCRTSPSM
jgi:hypothetical protein